MSVCDTATKKNRGDAEARSVDQPIVLTVICREYGGAYIARCNGRSASCTSSMKKAVERAAAKAIEGIAEMTETWAMVRWPFETRNISGGVWAVVYSPPKEAA